MFVFLQALMAGPNTHNGTFIHEQGLSAALLAGWLLAARGTAQEQPAVPHQAVAPGLPLPVRLTPDFQSQYRDG